MEYYITGKIIANYSNTEYVLLLTLKSCKKVCK